MPMTMASILSRPCLSGLRLRPRRLFGFDGTTDADPRSPTGSITPGAFGPAPATAPARIADPAIRDLQGVTPSPAEPAEPSVPPPTPSPHPSPVRAIGFSKAAPGMGLPVEAGPPCISRRAKAHVILFAGKPDAGCPLRFKPNVAAAR